MKLFSTSIQVFRGTSFSYFKIKVPFFCCPLCQIISRPLCHNQKNGKPAVSITTLVLQDQPQGYILSYFYRLVRALSHSRIFVEFSLSAVYSSIVGELSNSCCSDYWKMHLRVKKIVSRHFTHPSPQTRPPGFYHHHPGRQKLHIPLASQDAIGKKTSKW